MRFASVSYAGRPTVIVEIRRDGAVTHHDVGALLDRPRLAMTDLASEWPRLRGLVADRGARAGGDTEVNLSEVQWAAPSPTPSKIVGVALNSKFMQYFAHRPMAEPAFFLKPPSALIGHRQAIRIDPAWGVTHPEPELAAVIGRRIQAADEEEAVASVFGYTIMNDITSPGLKAEDSVELVMPQDFPVEEPWREMREDDHSIYLTYHARSKGSDTFAPMGPWLVTSDEVGNPDKLEVLGLHDGEIVLEDSTENLTFSVGRTLSFLSRSMTLLPGDVVHFGTASLPKKPEIYPTIRSIDLGRIQGTVAVEVQNIGRLENPIELIHRS